MIIAARYLSLETDAGPVRLAIRLRQPQVWKGLSRCDYEYDWPGEPSKSYAVGNDEIHAIFMAMQKIAQDLYMSRAHGERRLSWNKPWVGYGFPMPANGRDLLIGDDKRFSG